MDNAFATYRATSFASYLATLEELETSTHNEKVIDRAPHMSQNPFADRVNETTRIAESVERNAYSAK